jgi:hypothetical protein
MNRLAGFMDQVAIVGPTLFMTLFAGAFVGSFMGLAPQTPHLDKQNAIKKQLTPANPGPLPPQDWSGCYRITGKENDKEYTGNLVVSKHGGIYWVTFIVGNQAIKGVGQERGGMLCTGWSDGRVTGCSVLKRNDDGTIKATWCIDKGDGELNHEVMTVLK